MELTMDMMRKAREAAVQKSLDAHKESDGEEGLAETVELLQILTTNLRANLLDLLRRGLSGDSAGVPTMAMGQCVVGDPTKETGRTYTTTYMLQTMGDDISLADKLYASGRQFAEDEDPVVAIAFTAESWMIKRRIDVESAEEIKHMELPRPAEQPDRMTVIVVMLDNMLGESEYFYLPCETDEETGNLTWDGETTEDLGGSSMGANIDVFWRGYYDGLKGKGEDNGES